MDLVAWYLSMGMLRRSLRSASRFSPDSMLGRSSRTRDDPIASSVKDTVRAGPSSSTSARGGAMEAQSSLERTAASFLVLPREMDLLRAESTGRTASGEKYLEDRPAR